MSAVKNVGDTTEITIVPLGSSVGADVQGVDVSSVSDTQFALIRDAWMRHHVLRFRGQSLSKDALLSFSSWFGELEMAPINAKGEPWIEGHPTLAVMSNIEEDGAPIGSLGYGEAVWHTDMSYKKVTPSAAILYALEVTDRGGETGFLSMHRAYDSLPAELKEAVTGKSIKHDASRDSSGTLRKGFDAVDDARQAPGEVHPIVIRHPESGRQALYLGRRPFGYVVGLELDESEALLDALWAHATQEEFAWFQRWEVGDLLIWDNRSVLHTRRAFSPAERRYMLRTQIKGTAPSA
jgi:taurine dioxygenase